MPCEWSEPIMIVDGIGHDPSGVLQGAAKTQHFFDTLNLIWLTFTEHFVVIIASSGASQSGQDSTCCIASRIINSRAWRACLYTRRCCSSDRLAAVLSSLALSVLTCITDVRPTTLNEHLPVRLLGHDLFKVLTTIISLYRSSCRRANSQWSSGPLPSRSRPYRLWFFEMTTSKLAYPKRLNNDRLSNTTLRRPGTVKVSVTDGNGFSAQVFCLMKRKWTCWDSSMPSGVR